MRDQLDGLDGVWTGLAQETVEEQLLAVQDLKHGIFQCAMSKKGDKVEQSRFDVVLKIFRGAWRCWTCWTWRGLRVG